MNLMSYPSVKKQKTNLYMIWVYGRVVSSSFRLLRFRRNAEKTRKAESSTRSAGKKEREGQICGGFATQIPSETHMITSDVRVKIPTARSEKKSQNQARWSSSRCNMYDPFLEPSLLIWDLKSWKGLLPSDWNLNDLPTSGWWISWSFVAISKIQTYRTEWFAKGCYNLFIQQFLQKNTLFHVVRGPAVPHVICLQPIW